MKSFLDELTMEQLDGEALELAQTIGVEPFKHLVLYYGGSGRLYVPTVTNITAPIRNRHIYEDYKNGGAPLSKLGLKYELSESYIYQIVKALSKSEK